MGNINLQYSWRSENERKIMDSMFDQDSLAVFDFELKELEDNISNSTGKRNLTGYKVSAMDCISSGKLRSLNDCGIYRTLRSGEVRGDFNQDLVVPVSAPGLLAKNEKIFVSWNGRWAGPYEVNFRQIDHSYYIKPQIKENQYTVSSYAQEDVTLLEITLYDDYGYENISWNLMIPKAGAQPMQTDVISDEQLLEALRDSAQEGFTHQNRLRLDDIPGLLKRQEESVLAGGVLQEENRQRRLRRLEEILTSQAEVDATLGRVTEFICDLLVKHQNDPQVEQWLQELLKTHPDLMDQMKESRPLTARREQAERDLEDLRQQREELEQELANRKEETDSVNRSAVEAKKAQLLAMDTEYAQLRDRLADLERTLGVAGDLSLLQEKQRKYREDVAYLEAHKEHLRQDTGAMELEFQQMIGRFHEKMVDLTFDGFLSSKMLHAAAQWESEQETDLQTALVEQVNTLPELFRRSDFVNVSITLCDATRDLINAPVLAAANPDLLLVNTSRGGIVNEHDLYVALTTGQIRAAASDVFVHEPPDRDDPLIHLDNFIATFHIGGSTYESLERVSNRAVDYVFQYTGVPEQKEVIGS